MTTESKLETLLYNLKEESKAMEGTVLMMNAKLEINKRTIHSIEKILEEASNGQD